MKPSNARIFGALTDEAMLDAARRRIVPVVAVISLLSLFAVDSCTSCGVPSIYQNGVEIEIPEVAGWTGMLIFAVLALWIMVLAGFLASDHLTEVLSDGSAPLVLARPVGRGTFALSRLSGSLVIAFVTGAVLLGATTALLHARHGVPLDGALWGALACGLGAVSVASLSMSVSLFLPRTATAAIVVVAVGAIATINAAGLLGVELEGFAWGIDRFAPPLGSSLVTALASWIEPVRVPAKPLELAIRSAAWAIASPALLVTLFRRRDIDA